MTVLERTVGQALRSGALASLPALWPASRRRRRPIPVRLYDTEGREVLITAMCPRCRKVQPLSAFGLRRMPSGQIRDCPWCKACRAKPARKEA